MNQFVEIVFFALLAGYLIFRLWSVLGRETPEDMERRQRRFLDQENEQEKVDNVIPLPERNPSREKEIPHDDLTPGVREGIRKLQDQDATFQVDPFLKGAKGAYKIIIEAFASGDRETLKELLVEDVYQQFVKAIEEREKNHQEVGVHLESLEKMDIDAIDVVDKKAFITIRYRSRQVITTKDGSGEIIDNPAEISVPITDVWTFTRTIDSSDPNWQLSKTKTQSYRDM